MTEPANIHSKKISQISMNTPGRLSITHVSTVKCEFKMFSTQKNMCIKG